MPPGEAGAAWRAPPGGVPAAAVGVSDGSLTWCANFVSWGKIGTLIDADGGRYAMIVDYIPAADDPSGDAAFAALSKACHGKRADLQSAQIVCEGAYGPRDGKAGRVYLAVVDDIEPEDAMAKLVAAKLPCELVQIHPEVDPPKKKAKAAAKKPTKKKPAAQKKKAASSKGTRAKGTKRGPRTAKRRGR